MIDKKWLFGLLEFRYKQPNGKVLAEIGSHVKDVNRIAKLELGGGKNPEGIPERLLSKNGVLMEECHGLAGGVSIKSFKASDIFTNYRFKEEIMRRAATPPP